MKREAVFAGRWYPGDEAELRRAISGYLEPQKHEGQCPSYFIYKNP